MAVGLGVMLLVAIALLEANLGRQLAYEQKREAPSFFFIDVQPDQREPFSRLVGEVSGVAPTVTPVVRARLAAIDGKPVTRELIDRRKRESPEKNWYLTREYMLTWASAPPPANALTRGRWWTAEEASARPRVSVEDEAARTLNLHVGDSIQLSGAGITLSARVAARS